MAPIDKLLSKQMIALYVGQSDAVITEERRRLKYEKITDHGRINDGCEVMAKKLTQH
jgi:hypothetical protein